MTSPDTPPTYWQSLAHAADQGHLYLNADAAAACSKACDGYIEKLIDHQNYARELGNARGWGDFASGKQLQKIIADKAVGGENNLVDVLQSHIDVVEEMKIVFAKFFMVTKDGDDANAADFQARGPK